LSRPIYTAYLVMNEAKSSPPGASTLSASRMARSRSEGSTRWYSGPMTSTKSNEASVNRERSSA